jgi:ABC-type proline/glycine betaine transport system permease subunit
LNDFRIPLGTWVEDIIDFITDTLGFLFDFVATVVSGLYDIVDAVFSVPPFWAVIIVLAVLGFAARGWKFAIGTVIGLTLIVGVDQWDNAMDTLALVLVASIISILIAVPLGIAAAKSRTTSNFLRPILDFTQTMPAFVYLIPALILFGIGVVPGVVATIIFAVAPGVRLTELGIRGVDTEVVEAGQAFASSARSSSRWHCRASWPASTRSSCCRSPWSSSPAWSAPVASASPSSRASTASTWPSASRPACRS